MLGRINITEGKLVFFGSTYTVNSGSISFFNPIRVEPILDLSLETQAQGVDVVLKVTGPIDNMKLTYTSRSAAPVSGNRQLAGRRNYANFRPPLCSRIRPPSPHKAFSKWESRRSLAKPSPIPCPVSSSASSESRS